jgi:hypothetical protein
MSNNRVTSVVPSIIETGGDSVRVTSVVPSIIETGGDSVRVTSVVVSVIYQIPFEGGARPQINLIF